MSLTSALNAARSGLHINSLRADMVATNVANAATPGYARRSISIGENLVGGLGVGARSNGISRAYNHTLTTQRQVLSADVARANLVSSAWQTLSEKVGDSTSSYGLFSSIANFSSSLTQLIQSPESTAQQSSVLDAINNIAKQFHDLQDTATDLRAESDAEIASGVEIVNNALKRIEVLNGQIASTNHNAGDDVALIDERQRALDEISEYLTVTTIEKPGGVIDVVTSQGVFLLSGKAKQLEFTTGNSFTPQNTLSGGQLSGLHIDGIELTPNSETYSAISSGLFRGLFDLRDRDLPLFTDQLDMMARDLVSRFSEDTIDPTKTSGDYGLFTISGNPNEAGIAGRLGINDAVNPAEGGQLWRLRDGIGAASEGMPGNSSFIQALSDALEAKSSLSGNGFSGSYSSTEIAAHFSSMTGQSRIRHEVTLSSVLAQYSMISDLEHREISVDVDKEMSDLLMIEQAYAANARVIEVASQMINRLMEL